MQFSPIFPVDEIVKAYVTLERWFPEDFSDASFAWSTNYARKKSQSDPEDLRQRVQEALPGECEMYALSRAFLEEETKELLWDTEDLEIAITYFEKFVGSGNMCSGGIIVFEAV